MGRRKEAKIFFEEEADVGGVIRSSSEEEEEGIDEEAVQEGMAQEAVQEAGPAMPLNAPSAAARGKRPMMHSSGEDPSSKKPKITTSDAEEESRRERLEAYWKKERGFRFIYKGPASAGIVQLLEMRVDNKFVDMLLPEQKNQARTSCLELPALDRNGTNYVLKIMVKGLDRVYIKGDWQAFFRNNSVQGRNSVEIFSKRNGSLVLGMFLYRK